MANLADDMRQLQRSEIGEVAESFAAEQVGSSTMPHKRNPVSFENVKSIWKAMAPRVLTTYMDQISEHQRDLTNSASQRFLGEILAATAYAAARLAQSLDGMRVDRDRLKANLALSRSTIAAEPLYVLLAKYGHPDAHAAVRRLTIEAERGSRPLLAVAMRDDEPGQGQGPHPALDVLVPQDREDRPEPSHQHGSAQVPPRLPRREGSPRARGPREPLRAHRRRMRRSRVYLRVGVGRIPGSRNGGRRDAAAAAARVGAARPADLHAGDESRERPRPEHHALAARRDGRYRAGSRARGPHPPAPPT